MSDWDQFDYEVPDEAPVDPQQVAARDRLADFFDEHRREVFFSGQLAIQNEGDFFHWVTHRAVADLIAERVVETELRQLKTGGPIRLLWDRRNRFYKREAKKVVALVDEYSDPNICGALGLHGEAMILGGFARKEFVMRGQHARDFRGERWSTTDHNLDFIFERDDVAYGVEVKNGLSYMDLDEVRTKVAICQRLNVRPVFAVRMLPKTWIKEVIDAGGYAMILKYQL